MLSAHRTRTERAITRPCRLLLACALVIAGCGPDRAPEGDDAGAPERVKLEVKLLGDAPVQGKKVRRIRPFGKAEHRWSVAAQWSGRHVVKTEDGKQLPVLAAIDDSGVRRFSLAGQYALEDINQIWLGWHCGGIQQVEFRFKREGALVAAWGPEALNPSTTPQSMLFHPVWPAVDRTDCDELEMVFTGAEKRVGVSFVSLIDRTPTSFGEADGSASLWIGEGESRVVQWTNTERALAGDVRIPAESYLTFCYGVPRVARDPAADARLRVTATDSTGKNVEQSFSLQYTGAESSVWREARIRLGALAAGAGSIRFDVEVKAGESEEEKHEAAAAVGDVWIVTGRPPSKPSVLFVTTDTVRADHVAALGLGVDIRTPALDELARRGVVFANCWSSTNTTNPSHGAMFTGLSPRDTGIMDQMTPLSEHATTLAEIYRANGYSTWATISARHLGPPTSGLGQGFDRFSWPPVQWERRADETLAFAREWLEHSEGKPVFLWLHVFDAHFPYAPPDEYDRQYYQGSADPYDPKRPPVELPPKLAERDVFARIRDLDFERSQYRAEITYLDSELRPYFQTPRFRDGVVVVVADHGECLGEQNVLFDHADLSPSTLHVPLLLSWPGAPAGSRSEAPVMSTDIGRTLLSICGMQRVAFPGADLRERIAAPAGDVPRFAVAASRAQASLTFGKWHLVVHLNDHFEDSLYEPRSKHEVELYDIAADPNCLQNLVDSHAADAKKLRAALVNWLTQKSGDDLAGERSTDAELATGLQGLGYTTQIVGGRELWSEDDCDWCRRFR